VLYWEGEEVIPIAGPGLLRPAYANSGMPACIEKWV
jgi:hypothetical protein